VRAAPGESLKHSHGWFGCIARVVARPRAPPALPRWASAATERDRRPSQTDGLALASSRPAVESTSSRVDQQSTSRQQLRQKAAAPPAALA
jgi:hypothetical protein